MFGKTFDTFMAFAFLGPASAVLLPCYVAPCVSTVAALSADVVVVTLVSVG